MGCYNLFKITHNNTLLYIGVTKYQTIKEVKNCFTWKLKNKKIKKEFNKYLSNNWENINFSWIQLGCEKEAKIKYKELHKPPF